jgi:hypothetical protein
LRLENVTVCLVLPEWCLISSRIKINRDPLFGFQVESVKAYFERNKLAEKQTIMVYNGFAMTHRYSLALSMASKEELWCGSSVLAKRLRFSTREKV